MKEHYRRFLSAAPGRLHFAAHSHHAWPDVTREAHLQAWDDAARLADHKWDRIFGQVVPEAQGHIARILDLEDPGQIAFAPNTHEFVVRLLSCLPPGKRPRIVTTDSEFMSFSRQTARLEEDGLAEVVRVSAEPFDTFASRFIEAARVQGTDMVFFSQVFFNSGFVVRDLERIVASAPADALVIVDGYHAFFAVPTSLRSIADRAFYVGGGYKYAQAGEGACFLAVPRGFDRRPVNTGWFAGFGSLEAGDFARVSFSSDGFRLMGATFDPSALYRLNAVARLFEGAGVSVSDIHTRVKALQRAFLEGLAARPGASPGVADLIAPVEGIAGTGHFLTFRRPDAAAIEERLAARNVVVDHRGDRLRFGFGMYQDESDVAALLDCL